MSIAPTEAPIPLLNSAHRCDVCQSRAYVRAVLIPSPRLPQGGSLLFCSHHMAQYEFAIFEYLDLDRTVDEREELTEHVKDDHHVN